jgi:hypothetical protein
MAGARVRLPNDVPGAACGGGRQRYCDHELDR